MKSTPAGGSLPAMRVRPTSPGLKVPIPERAGRFLAPEGETVRPSAYWTRRVAEGSVELVPELEQQPSTEARPARRAPKE